MGTKDCGRWALHGFSEVAGVSARGGQVAGVLVAGGSVLALSTVMEVSWDIFEGSATAEKSVRDFEFTERFQDFSKDFKISAKISRFQRRFQDFKISAKISDFARISAEISRFHVISGEISRFQQRFHGSQRTAYSQGTLRGAGASATECDTASPRVCMREVKGIC